MRQRVASMQTEIDQLKTENGQITLVTMELLLSFHIVYKFVIYLLAACSTIKTSAS